MMSNHAVTVELSITDIMILSNALNEILNGLDLSEFQTRIGVEYGEAQNLLSQFKSLIDP